MIGFFLLHILTRKSVSVVLLLEMSGDAAAEVGQLPPNLLDNFLNPTYKPRRLKHKGAILTLFWNFSVLMAFILYLRSKKLDEIQLPYQIVLGCSTIAFPISGWLADVYIGRYRVIKYSLVFTWLAAIVYVLAQIFEEKVRWFFLVAIGVGLCSYATFQANAIQFGMDQLVDASSSDISSYVSWYAWAYFVSDAVGIFSQHTICDDYTPLASFIVPAILTLCICSDICCGDWLIKEPATFNPFRLIFKVLLYAAKNKYPRQRSAFTYWDDKRYSRIDLAKSKYGGPFTTEQVEDVKTFFRILVIVFLGSLFAGLVFVVGVTVGHEMIPHYQDPHFVNESCTDFSHFVRDAFETSFVHAAGSLTMVVLIPVFEILLYPLLWKCMPRLGIMNKFIVGMILHLLFALSLMTLEVIGHHVTSKFGHEGNRTVVCMLKITEYDPRKALILNFKWIAITKVFDGLGTYCLLTSTMEFICAQSPYSMKGLLGGILYSICSLSVLLSTLLTLPFRRFFDKEQVGNLKFGCGIWYFLSVSVITIMFIILAIIVSKCYTQRRRDENIHNEHMFAVDYYDRYIT